MLNQSNLAVPHLAPFLTAETSKFSLPGWAGVCSSSLGRDNNDLTKQASGTVTWNRNRPLVAMIRLEGWRVPPARAGPGRGRTLSPKPRSGSPAVPRRLVGASWWGSPAVEAIGQGAALVQVPPAFSLSPPGPPKAPRLTLRRRLGVGPVNLPVNGHVLVRDTSRRQTRSPVVVVRPGSRPGRLKVACRLLPARPGRTDGLGPGPKGVPVDVGGFDSEGQATRRGPEDRMTRIAG